MDVGPAVGGMVGEVVGNGKQRWVHHGRSGV